jgi:AraC-like DNA-binding protein
MLNAITPPTAYQRFTTADVPRNHEFGFWRDVIGDTYFNLQLAFKDSQHFRGTLEAWNLGLVSLSKLQCSPLSYQRLRQHCQGGDSQILVTVPLMGEVEFSQLGRETRCAPGQFILEHSEEPYEFRHGAESCMWVIKVPEASLNSRIGNTSRYCAQHFDTTSGMGRLFNDYLHLITRHCNSQQSSRALALMGGQLIDLLSIALNEAPSALQSSLSIVRGAHLARIEAYVRQHLADPDLSPELLASQHGISLRYLHALFRDTGHSVAQWIRDLRLQAAFEQLQLASQGVSIAQIAYACGFNDQAQFNHAFRRRFDHPPGDVIRKSVSELAS